MRRSIALALFLVALAPDARASLADGGAQPVAVAATPDSGRVALANGDVIRGVIAAQDDAIVVLVHPQLGRLEIARAGVRELAFGEGDAVEAAPAQDDSSVAAEAADPTDPEEDQPERSSGFFGTRLLRGWKSSIGAGITGSWGGFEDSKLNVLFQTGVRDERRRWDFDSAYFLNVSPKTADSPKSVSKNQGFAVLRRDWYFPERWKKFFAWAQAAYNYDDFQPWKHRVGGHAGPAYRLLSSEKWELDGRIGMGVARTFGDRDTTSPEAIAGFELRWTPVEWHEFNTRNDLYVDVIDPDRHRTVQSFNWILRFEREGGLGFKLSALYQFDSQSEGKVNDLTYLGSLTYDF